MNDLSSFIPHPSAFILLFCAVWLGIAILSRLRERHAHPAPPEPETLPTMSIIVPALNEETTIERGMRSLLELDYPHLEIIAVDDRSTDSTGTILDRLAAEYPDRLRVVHIETLPPDWLGKCHALHVASQQARGDWLLFTDADVIFEPNTLRLAASFAVSLRADHFVFLPRMLWHGYVEAAILSLFALSLVVAFQTWRVESRSTRSFIGIGAFNMIRRELYDRFGGHVPLRLEVADDMKLGYLAKEHGGRSVVVNSDGAVRVRWREGAIDVVRGMERSGFAGIGFSWLQIVLAVIFFGGVMLAPYVLPLLSPTPHVLWTSLSSIAMILAANAITALSNGLPLWIGVLHPVACVLYVVALARSAVVTTINGGLAWRGTFYTIEQLKRGSVGRKLL